MNRSITYYCEHPVTSSPRVTGSFTLALLVFLLLGANGVQAQQTTSLPFLTIGPDAFSLSTGEARTAVLNGAADIFTNPANLAMEKKSSVGASYTLWISDTQISHAAVNILKGNQAFAVGVLTNTVNHFEARQVAGPSQGTFSLKNFAMSAAYSRKIGPVSLGASALYIYQSFYQASAGGYAFSFGASANILPNRLRLSTALLNTGRMGKLNEQASRLPTSFNAGVWTRLIQFATPGYSEIPVSIAASADFTQPVNETNIDATGSESTAYKQQKNGFVTTGVNVTVAGLIDLRAGYRFLKSSAREVSFGLGLQTNGIHMDFAYIPFNTGYGNAYSVGLKYYF
ncbi:MAG TPA: PorV/PorQ family protein [Balneolales bacterium]|nr:PorV/PorQ family protein [Balneolales bacterium]